jgi:hypothetical protein
MLLGEWGRLSRIAEFLCPLPVLESRHVFPVFAEEVVAFTKLVAEQIDRTHGPQAMARNILQSIRRKVNSGSFL